MLEDDRIRETLLQSELATPETVRELEQLAERHGTTLYRASVESGHVEERDLVSQLAGNLGVASVSLERFSGKPELFAILPPPVVKKYRALPVGLRSADGETTLFVAMEDPHDLDALEAIAQCCVHPVTPVLAGVIDLERAIERIYAPPTEPLRIEHTAPSYRKPESPPEPLGGLFADFGSGSASQSASAAALSLLDDIPRSRHDDVTPVSGIGFEVPDAIESWSFSQLPVDGREPTDQGRAVRSPSQSGFLRRGPAGGSGWRSRRADEVLGALVRVLVAKGVMTEDELVAALDE